MSKPYSFSKVDIDVDAGSQPSREVPEPETPFRILILGDFSGRANRGICEPTLVGRRPIPVDRDNFEEVLERLLPELRLTPQVSLRFRELEDFHPDRIFERVELFKALRETREKLSDRSTFAAAAAALQPPEPAAPPASAPPAKVSLDDLVEETGTRQAERPARALDQFQTLVRDLVAPHLVPRADPRQAEYIAQVDAATSEAMRGLLQRPEFQELEAAWRGLFFLVRRLETDVELKLYLLDVSKDELAAGLGQAEPLPGRGRLHPLRDGGWLLDESYNAVMESVLACAQTLLTLEGGEAIAVLGCMRELGPGSEQLHRQTGEGLKALGLDRVLVYGDDARALAEGFGLGALDFPDYEALRDDPAGLGSIPAGARILVKGSLVWGASRAVAWLLDALNPQSSSGKP